MLLRLHRLFHIHRGALAWSSLELRTVLAAITLTPTASSKLFKLLGARLTEVLKIDLHNFLDQIVHLGLILDHFSDVDDFFAFQEV